MQLNLLHRLLTDPAMWKVITLIPTLLFDRKLYALATFYRIAILRFCPPATNFMK